MYRSFEDLEVWKRACNLAVQVYASLRDCRDYGLRDQMQRAAVSIASNIAEGAERPPKEFSRFLTIARGSAAELRTLLKETPNLKDKDKIQGLIDKYEKM